MNRWDSANSSPAGIRWEAQNASFWCIERIHTATHTNPKRKRGTHAKPKRKRGTHANPKRKRGTHTNPKRKLRDLGRTTVLKEWEIVFPVRNRGTRRLVLNETASECNCEDRAARTILIPPGETARVSVTLDTRFASGPLQATAAFTTNDPAHPTLTLTVRACVDAPPLPGHSPTDDDPDVSIVIRQ